MAANALAAGRIPTEVGSRWSARIVGTRLIVTLKGEWTVRDGVTAAADAEGLLRTAGLVKLAFDTGGLGHWDSSLLAFLAGLRAACQRLHLEFDAAGLPEPACRLLDMLPVEAQAPVLPAPADGIIGRVGGFTLRLGSDARDLTALVGEATLRVLPALRGRARTRLTDLWTFIRDAGTGALPMVALVNTLVGGIVAFVGAIQLLRFGAAIYVSNLIGVMEIREMGPLVTAIVMAGRTGSAYASEIATMQGSDEIDALRALGIPLFDYLILPRVTALSVMMPLLFVYAAAVGIAGGLVVAISLMNLSLGGFLAHLRGAVGVPDLFLGLFKSISFGIWIAISSCRIGLKAGRSATDVGNAATAAAVNGIVGVIALDAVFDVCAHALGI